MIMRSQLYVRLLPLFLIALSACSLKDRQVQYGVSLKLSPSVQQRLSRANVFDAAFIDLNGDTLDDGFQCFALNVTGAGISAPPRFGCSDPSQYLGVMGGMAPIEGGQVDVLVPAGAGRKIQLIGFKSSIGCPNFAEMISIMEQTGSNGPDGIGDAYLLGETEVDVFGDTTVTIPATFDENRKFFNGCEDGGGSDPMELTFSVINQSPVLKSGECVKIGIEAHLSSTSTDPMPSFRPLVSNVQGTGTIAMFDSVPGITPCGAGTSYDLVAAPYLSFPTGQRYKEMYIQIPATITHLDLQVGTSATGWTQPTVTYAVVGNKLDISTYAPGFVTYPSTSADSGACVALSLADFRYGYWADLIPNQNYHLNVYNNTSSGNTASAVEIYHNSADCMARTANTAITGSWDGHSLNYTLSFTSISTLYIRNANIEKLSFSLSTDDDSAQPARYGVHYAPVAMTNHVTPQFPLDGGVSVSAPPVNITLTGDLANVTGIVVGAATCSGLSGSNGSYTCQVPAQTTAGIKPIKIRVNTASGSVLVDTGKGVHYLPFARGNGSNTHPYEVGSKEAFFAIGIFNGAVFLQIQTIDLANDSPATDSYIAAFSGMYDGGGYALENGAKPLFNNCNNGSSIRNLELSNFVISESANSLGAVCNYAYADLRGITLTGGSIRNSASTSYTGALTGYTTGTATIDTVVSTMSVDSGAGDRVGGLIGFMDGGVLERGFVLAGTRINNGVANSGGYVGGLVGYLASSGAVAQSFSRATVENGYSVGGLIGKVWGGTVKESFAEGAVSNATGPAGGLIGFAGNASQVIDNFSSGTVQSSGVAGGFVGAIDNASFSYNHATTSIISGSSSGGFYGTLANTTLGTGNYMNGAGGRTTTGVTALDPANSTSYSGLLTRSVWSSRTTFGFPVQDWGCTNLNLYGGTPGANAALFTNCQ